MLGEDAEWSLTDHLLALVYDALAMANWQRSGKGERPKPLPRPGSSEEGNRIGGGTVMTIEEARAWRAKRREG